MIISRCKSTPNEPDLFKDPESIYLFEIYDGHGSLAWNGALGKKWAVMYSLDFGTQDLPQRRIYFKVAAMEHLSIDNLFEGKKFQGLGMKLIETKARAKVVKELSKLEEKLLAGLKMKSNKIFSTREPFTGFELFIPPDLKSGYNVYDEMPEERLWYGWGKLEGGLGKLTLSKAP